MRPGTIAAMAFMAAVLILPAFFIDLRPYENAPVNNEGAAESMDIPGPKYHAPNPRTDIRLRDSGKPRPADGDKDGKNGKNGKNGIEAPKDSPKEAPKEAPKNPSDPPDRE